MTRFIETTPELFAEILDGKRNFFIARPNIKCVAGDTIIIQDGTSELKAICTAVETPEENAGLKSGHQAIAFHFEAAAGAPVIDIPLPLTGTKAS